MNFSRSESLLMLNEIDERFDRLTFETSTNQRQMSDVTVDDSFGIVGKDQLFQMRIQRSRKLRQIVIKNLRVPKEQSDEKAEKHVHRIMMKLENRSNHSLKDLCPNENSNGRTEEKKRIQTAENRHGNGRNGVNSDVSTVEKIIARATRTEIPRIDRSGEVAGRIRIGKNGDREGEDAERTSQS